MKKYKRLISTTSITSDSSDDVPVAAKRKCKDGLYKHEFKACEFCDKVVYSQYDMLVHNAHHIIIPLQNQTVYQCTVCLYHYTSLEELQFHSAVKHGIPSSQLQKLHKNVKENGVSKPNITKEKLKDKQPDILQSIITRKPVVSCDNSVNVLITKKNERNIECLVDKQPIIRCDNVITELVKNNNVNKKDNGIKSNKEVKNNDLKEKVTVKLIQTDVRVDQLPNVNSEERNKFKLHLNEGTSKASTLNSKSRIVFEDDSDLEIYDDDADFDDISPIIEPAAISNPKSTPVINPVPVYPVFETTSDPVFTPITTPNTILPIPSNLIETAKGLNVEILDLCSDESRDKNDDYILPDAGPLDTRLFDQDPSYILPDCGPLLPVPPMGIQPSFGKIILGRKVPQIDPYGQNSISTVNLLKTNQLSQNGSYSIQHNSTNVLSSFNANLNTSIPIFNNIKLDNNIVDVEANQNLLVPINQKILLGTKVADTVKYSPSVHYDDLKSPGLYTCKRCRQKFPTRFELITHETSHITITKKIQPTSCKNCPICDWYITGGFQGMKRHKKNHHPPEMWNRYHNQFTCNTCKLKYRRYASHEWNYHKIYACQKCGLRFEKEDERTSHVERNCFEAYKNLIEEDQKVLKMCELCVLFLKDKNSVKYLVCGESSEEGRRQNCERCFKEFFELKLVKRIQKRKKYGCGEKPVKKNSNNVRLKNIQSRLKKFNKLSRC